MDDVACQQCEIGFEDGEEIIGISGAIVSEADDAIIADDQPWLTLYHVKCWEIVIAAVNQVMGVNLELPPSEAGDVGQPDRVEPEASMAEAGEADPPSDVSSSGEGSEE